MRKMSLMISALVLVMFSSIASAQVGVVQKYRSQYPTPMGAENTLKMLKQVAAETKHGIYKKTSGNNCGGYSCDIICFGGAEGVDVLSDSEGAANPTWNPVHDLNGANCEMVDPGGGGGGGGGDTSNAATVEAQQVQIGLLLQIITKQQEQIVVLQSMSAGIQQGLADLKASFNAGIKIRF